MTNVIYPMPVIVLKPRSDDYGTVYLPANVFATKLNKLMGRYIKEADLPILEDMGFGLEFPNGQLVLPYPHNAKPKKMERLNIMA